MVLIATSPIEQAKTSAMSAFAVARRRLDRAGAATLTAEMHQVRLFADQLRNRPDYRGELAIWRKAEARWSTLGTAPQGATTRTTGVFS